MSFWYTTKDKDGKTAIVSTDVVGAFILFIAVMGIVAAVVIPNFILYQAKARQAEAKTNLGVIWVKEHEFFQEHKRYGTFEEIGFSIPGKLNRYTYRIDVSGRPGTVIPGKDGTVTPDNTVVPAGFSATGFTATATANLDNDSTLDQWHVNDQKQGLGKADVGDVTN